MRIDSSRRAARAATALAFVLSATVAGACSNNDDPEVAVTTSTTARVSTSTTAPASTSTTASGPSTAVWPVEGSGTHFTTPVAAAKSFAEDLVGFESPIVGAFAAGDARSGEVPIRPVANGPVTTVLVRQLGPGDDWSVLGSTTANIVVTKPAAMDSITSPATLSGRSTAFEANVNTSVREDGNAKPLGEHFVMGGGNGDVAPFNGTIEFSKPTKAAGAVLFRTLSARDGEVWEASVVRVRFGS